GFSEEPRHPAMYLLDTRWKQMHNAMRVREGTVASTGSHPHSRWSLCAQGHSILSQYQAYYGLLTVFPKMDIRAVHESILVRAVLLLSERESVFPDTSSP